MSFDQFFSTSCYLVLTSYFFDEMVLDRKFTAYSIMTFVYLVGWDRTYDQPVKKAVAEPASTKISGAKELFKHGYLEICGCPP